MPIINIIQIRYHESPIFVIGISIIDKTYLYIETSPILHAVKRQNAISIHARDICQAVSNQDGYRENRYVPNITKSSKNGEFAYFGGCAVLHSHDDGIKSKHFPRYWPFVRGNHRWPLNSPHKGQWRRALMFSLWTIVRLMIWDAIALIMTSPQCHQHIDKICRFYASRSNIKWHLKIIWQTKMLLRI